MILPKWFPMAGGRQMQRWTRFQKTMSKKRWLELDKERNGPITLFDFSILDDAIDAALVDESGANQGWRISDDSVIGGYSRATFQLIRTANDYKRYMNGDPPIPFLEKHENQDEEDDYQEDLEDEPTTEFTPFVRWKGNIDTRVGETSDAQSSGFCAIRSPEFAFSGVDLEGRYNGLEIKCRSDGRSYALILRLDSFIPDDTFQCFINIPPTIPPGNEVCAETGGKYDNLVLLFQHFFVASGGRMRAVQRDLDNSIKIQSIGLTLMDGKDGDFQFDLARIRAVNYDDRGVIGLTD